MEFRLMNHAELTDDQLCSIADIKSQHWAYSADSQIKWIETTYKQCDTHILLVDNEVIIGYVAIAQVSIVADDASFDACGVSCLCVSKEHLNKGYGLSLMERALRFAKDNNKIICLLCKEKLVNFYKKCGYVEVNPKSILVEQATYDYKLMFFDDIMCSEVEALKAAKNISIDRNF